MSCPACGQPIEAFDAKCIHCGKPLIEGFIASADDQQELQSRKEAELKNPPRIGWTFVMLGVIMLCGMYLSYWHERLPFEFSIGKHARGIEVDWLKSPEGYWYAVGYYCLGCLGLIGVGLWQALIVEKKNS